MEDEDYAGSNRNQLNAREQACIQLRVPESGTPWLDNLIRKSIREENKVVGPNPSQFSLFGGGDAG